MRFFKGIRKVIKLEDGKRPRIAPFHGVAYIRLHTPEIVTYIIPLNLIVRGLKKVWAWIRFLKTPDLLFRIHHQAYQAGFLEAMERQKNKPPDIFIVQPPSAGECMGPETIH